MIRASNSNGQFQQQPVSHVKMSFDGQMYMLMRRGDFVGLMTAVGLTMTEEMRTNEALRVQPQMIVPISDSQAAMPLHTSDQR